MSGQEQIQAQVHLNRQLELKVKERRLSKVPQPGSLNPVHWKYSIRAQSAQVS
jgi:hypothetical protein